MINAIIFDFDGVLVESVDIKTQAFKNLFSFAPNHINDIIEYHKVHRNFPVRKVQTYLL